MKGAAFHSFPPSAEFRPILARHPPGGHWQIGHKKARSREPAMTDQETIRPYHPANDEPPLGDDLITGAEQIAREMQWKMKDGRWNRRRVYHLAAQGEAPIYRVKGLGICARRSALRKFFAALDERAMQKLRRESEGQED